MLLFGGILTAFFFGHERGTRVCASSFLLQKIANPFWRLDSPRAFLLIAAFGQFGGNGSQCAEQTIMALVGAGGEE